jgi:hypothetical protein
MRRCVRVCVTVAVSRVTISPDDINCVRIHTMVNGRRCDDRFGDRAVRTLNLARNPTSAARSFLELYHAVVYYVLGWDASAKRPLTAVYDKQPSADRGGLLGVVRAWAACIETQARGSLHMHILVWAAGHDNLTRRFTEAHRRKLFVDRQPIAAPLPQSLPRASASEPFPPAPITFGAQLFGGQRVSDAVPSVSAAPPAPASVNDHLDHKHSVRPPCDAVSCSCLRYLSCTF